MFVNFKIETDQNDEDFHDIFSGERNCEEERNTQIIESFSEIGPATKIAEVSWGFGRKDSCSIYSSEAGIIVHYFGDDSATYLEMTGEYFLLEMAKISGKTEE